MSKIASFISLVMVKLDRNEKTPLHRQLYKMLRQEILIGQLKPGTRLPPTRTLAQELGVARNTVNNAYKQLLVEGYLESKVGSGTRVTKRLPEELLQVNSGRNHQGELVQEEETAPALLRGQAASKPRVSECGTAMMQIPYRWEKTQACAFNSTLPAVDAFPFKLWEKLLIPSWRSVSSQHLGYQSVLGYRPLREAVAAYLQTGRGVRCTADRVIITNGTQQALTTTARLLLNKGDTAWVENPCYDGIKAVLSAAMAKIAPIPVYAEGLVVSHGIANAPHARLAYVSPSHQYPLGVTMSLTRRLELLHWAQESRAWILEDDYDSEYRYAGYPLAALQGLDNAGRVIYVGTFSKVLFPALRVGYMVVPQSLIEPFRAARAHTDRGTTLLEQVVLTRFINERHFARHIRHMRTLYAERQAVFIVAAQKYLKGLLDVQPSTAGLHLVGWLPDGCDDEAIAQKLLENGIDTPALSSFAITPLSRKGLVIGYAAVPTNEIAGAVKRMGRVLAKI